MKNMRNVLLDIIGDEITPGEVIRGARIKLNLSQDDMEEITGIKRSNLSALENERIAMTSHYAEILAVVLNLHPADILYPNGNVDKTKELLEIEKKANFLIQKKVVG